MMTTPGLGEGNEQGVLLRRGLSEFNTLLNVALETGNTSLKKLLLLVGDAIQDVDSLLSTSGL